MVNVWKMFFFYLDTNIEPPDTTLKPPTTTTTIKPITTTVNVTATTQVLCNFGL